MPESSESEEAWIRSCYEDENEDAGTCEQRGAYTMEEREYEEVESEQSTEIWIKEESEGESEEETEGSRSSEREDEALGEISPYVIDLKVMKRLEKAVAIGKQWGGPRLVRDLDRALARAYDLEKKVGGKRRRHGCERRAHPRNRRNGEEAKKCEGYRAYRNNAQVCRRREE